MVAANIKNRNSIANLELVLELYEKMLNLQKVNNTLAGCMFKQWLTLYFFEILRLRLLYLVRF